MIRKLLVPLDGSPLAETALPFATVMASRMGASLTLIRAAKNSSLHSNAATDQYRVISTAEQYLHELTDQLTAQGLEIETAVPFGGSPADWIVEEGELRHIDLVIMATHAREHAERWLHGSVAEAVVHRSHVPVMLVHAADGDEFAARVSGPQPSIVVPLDSSALAESALPFAIDLANGIGARLVLVGVVPREGQLVAGIGGAITTYVGEDHTSLEAAARTYLASAAEHVASAGTEVETLIRYGDAANEIIALVAASAPVAVVMATHGRSGLVRSMLGSVAGAVAGHTPTPVVLIHPASIRPSDAATEASVTHVTSTAD